MINQGFNPYAPSVPFYPSYGNMQPQAQTGTNVSWVYVNGLEGARNQIVQPNNVSWMMDNNEPRIYVKAVDGMGTVTLKAFQLEEIDQNAPAAFANDGNEYASRNDVAALRARIEHLEKELGGINA